MRWLVLAALCACAHAAAPPHDDTLPPESPPSHKPRRQVVTETQIEVLEPIRFVGQTATIELASLPTLDAIAATIAGNPSILLLEVRGYGADGAPEFQQQMGAQRANAVVAELVKRKVEASRLRARGEAAPPAGSSAQIELVIAARR